MINTLPKIKAMKAVYTYFFPEVRSLIHSTATLDDRMFLTTTPVEEAQKVIDSLGLNITVPSNDLGNVDLDALHEPVIDNVVKAYEGTVKGLKEFPYRYFTSGSSQGIFHVLAELAAQGTRKIHTSWGEYEGYKEYAKAVGIETKDFDLHYKRLRKDMFFVSNPSARDGNIIDNAEIQVLCDRGNKVFVDLAYVGSTPKHTFDVSHENIPAVFLSFSKPYGVFRFRIGFTFSREPINSLYANKWFKDVPRLLAAAKIAEDIGPERLHSRYKDKQNLIVNSLNERYDLNLEASDALLIARTFDSGLDKVQRDLLQPFKRGNGYRLCLTPYYEELERAGGLM